MCIHIDSRCVILNILQARKSASLSDLEAFAAAFKHRCHAAYVDISDASVFSVIEDNPELLSLTESTIFRAEAFGSFAKRDFLDGTINRRFPAEVRRHLRECAETVC